MKDLDIGKHWIGSNQGLRSLFIEIDGKVAILDGGQKLNYLEQFGAVFIGPMFADKYSVTVELEPGRFEVLRGYTQDKTIVQLYRDFLAG